MSRADYENVLGQMRELSAKVPLLAQRLWETEGLGEDFAVTSDRKTYGRALDKPTWDMRRYDLRVQLEQESRGGGPVWVEHYRHRLAELEREVGGLPRAARERRIRDFYTAMRADPTARATAARIAVDSLDRPELDEAFRSSDPDVVLDAVARLRERGATFFGDVGPLATMALERLPRLDQLLADKYSFPDEMRTTRTGEKVPVGVSTASAFQFRALPRRFHGVWKGFPLKECVAAHPQRWATVALEGARVYYVEREGNHLGFVQHVPLDSHQGIVASTEIGAPALRNKIYVRDGASGALRATTLYSEWIAHAPRHLPAEWRGMAIGNSGAVNNAGVLALARESFAYRFGQAVTGLRHRDPLAARIAGVSSEGHKGYGGQMILDATIPQTTYVTLLMPELASGDAAQREKIFASADLETGLRQLAHLERVGAPIPATPRVRELQNILASRARLAKLLGAWNRDRGVPAAIGIFGTLSSVMLAVSATFPDPLAKAAGIGVAGFFGVGAVYSYGPPVLALEVVFGKWREARYQRGCAARYKALGQ